MSMIRLSGALAAALLLAAPAFANAPPPPVAAATTVAPDIFVQSIYDTLKEAEAVSPEFGASMVDSAVLRHFTPELLALYKTAGDIPEPIIDGNVFWDAQEWDYKAEMTYAVTANDGKSATVEASFKQGDETRKITYTLKAFLDGWQIDDITGGAGSMRAWLTKGISEYKPH